MKKILLYCSLFIALVSFVHAGIPDIVKALKAGNASEIARYFDNNVEITLPDKSISANKQQAEAILQNFFKENPVKDFKVLHQGKNQSSEYCIGTLVTGNGVFRTTIYTKEKNGIALIQELRFEK